MRPLIPLFLTATLAFSQTPAEITTTLDRVVDWQLENAWDTAGYNRRHSFDNNPRGWTYGALYVGLDRWADKTKDQRAKTWLADVARKENYSIYENRYFADFFTVCQLYLELYREHQDPNMLAPTQSRLDWIIANPSKQGLDIDGYKQTQRWTWCDALFMAPPVWAKMTSITGDQKYSDFMLAEYKATTDELFDPETNLYWRDHSYINKRVNGKKVFWSRGNGWVFGSLPLLLEEYEKDTKEYQYFEALFKKMAPAIRDLQTPQGHWSMSLVNAENYPTPETSGTAFFAFGFAWGINNGLLDRDEYLPTIKKAWVSLKSHVHDNGMLGYVQAVGAGPDGASPRYTEVYGVGALLAAGSELLTLFKTDNTQGAMTPSKKTGFTFARHIPERSDDFAFENDKIAFRLYGPALKDSTERSGIDLWLKRTDQPIINKWYADNAKGKSYHTDHGEGYDPYKVGDTLGGGGLGLWVDGKLVTANVYESYNIISSTPEKHAVKFTYTYPNGINEHRTYTIEPGTHFVDISSQFLKDKQPVQVEIAAGLTTHKGNAAIQNTPSAQWTSTWEKIDDSHLGTAVILPAGTQAKATTDKNHALLITQTNAKGQFTYKAGFAWQKSGAVTSLGHWIQTIEKAADE